MKRLTLIATISALAVATAAPALAKPGGGGGGGDRGGGIGAGINAGGRGTMEINRGMGRGTDRMTTDRINNGQLMKGEAATGSRIPESATRARGKSNLETTTMAGSTLTGVETGMTVNDSGGATIGTVTGVITKGNGSIRAVQVTLTSGQIITLAPNGLTLDGDVLVSSSTTSTLKSQGPAHANINGLINASPNSVLATAGVTSLTGLDTGLTVNDSGGTLVGTVDEVILNRAGAVVAIRVALDGGGTAIVPATTLSMDGTTVVTSSTQF